MLRIHIDLEPDEISRLRDMQSYYKTLNLPYYIMNINEDIKLIQEFEKVSINCFHNSIRHFKSNLNLLLIDDNMRKIGTNVIVCPKRNDILEYTNWFNTENKLYDKVTDTTAVEMPILFNSYVAANILLSMNKNKVFIYHSSFINIYFDCIYIIKMGKSLNVDCQIVKTLDQFKSILNENFIPVLKSFLITVSEISAYVKAGNFYGAKFHKYEQKLKSFANSISSLSLE